MADPSKLSHLLDISVGLEAVLAGPTLRVGDLLALKVGGLIVTPRPAGDNVEVLAGGACLGVGELDSANGRTVVRIVRFHREN